MKNKAYLWLLIPILGLGEWIAQRRLVDAEPSQSDWDQVSQLAASMKEPGDFILTTPSWAEVHLRQRIGDTAITLEELSRPDEAHYERAIVVSLGAPYHSKVADWILLSSKRQGPFIVELRKNPAPIHPLYVFSDHFGEDGITADLIDGSKRDTHCEYSAKARATTGGLYSHPALGRERYQCRGGAVRSLSVTIVDDKKFEPFRCIWSAPQQGAEHHFRFEKTPHGKKIAGYLAFSQFIQHEIPGTGAELEVLVDEKSVGVVHFDLGEPRKYFEFALPETGQSSHSVEFRTRSSGHTDRSMCYYAEILP